MVIPRHLLNEIPTDSTNAFLQIYLKGNKIPMLGELFIRNDEILFEPVIPFTHGKTYEIRVKEKLITEISIEPVNRKLATAASLAIYPSADTLPENLLKFYIVFSKPMQEGSAANNIQLIKNGIDTMPNVFFDLLTELWNYERTTLTLWLDPGRIKRDLQPNKKIGAPLHRGNHYQLLINANWQDVEGISLREPFRKDFVVGGRDSSLPNYSRWNFNTPEAGSTETLQVVLYESLDYLLLKKAVQVKDKEGNVISGFFWSEEKETILAFTPREKWKPGEYLLEVESRLEDLAGNNLNRPFDRDISNKDTMKNKKVYNRSFIVQ